MSCHCLVQPDMTHKSRRRKKHEKKKKKPPYSDTESADCLYPHISAHVGQADPPCPAGKAWTGVSQDHRLYKRHASKPVLEALALFP